MTMALTGLNSNQEPFDLNKLAKQKGGLAQRAANFVSCKDRRSLNACSKFMNKNITTFSFPLKSLNEELFTYTSDFLKLKDFTRLNECSKLKIYKFPQDERPRTIPNQYEYLAAKRNQIIEKVGYETLSDWACRRALCPWGRVREILSNYNCFSDDDLKFIYLCLENWNNSQNWHPKTKEKLNKIIKKIGHARLRDLVNWKKTQIKPIQTTDNWGKASKALSIYNPFSDDDLEFITEHLETLDNLQNLENWKTTEIIPKRHTDIWEERCKTIYDSINDNELKFIIQYLGVCSRADIEDCRIAYQDALRSGNDAEKLRTRTQYENALGMSVFRINETQSYAEKLKILYQAALFVFNGKPDEKAFVLQCRQRKNFSFNAHDISELKHYLFLYTLGQRQAEYDGKYIVDPTGNTRFHETRKFSRRVIMPETFHYAPAPATREFYNPATRELGANTTFQAIHANQRLRTSITGYGVFLVQALNARKDADLQIAQRYGFPESYNSNYHYQKRNDGLLPIEVPGDSEEKSNEFDVDEPELMHSIQQIDSDEDDYDIRESKG